MIVSKPQTVFVSGSLSVTELSDFAKVHVRSIVTNRMNALIGDAYGADKAIQQELYKKYDYPFVTVYASNSNIRSRVLYIQRRRCDFGFMLWDGKSKGTLNNIERLLSMNKLSIVCLSNKHKSFKIENRQQLDDMLDFIKEIN